MRNAAGEFHHFNAALDVASCIRNRLTMFGRKQFREAVEFLLDQVEKLEHDAGATLRIGRRPARLGCLRVGDGMLYFGMFGECDPGLHLSGIGIENIAKTARPSLDRLATDEMADLTHGSRSSDF